MKEKQLIELKNMVYKLTDFQQIILGFVEEDRCAKALPYVKDATKLLHQLSEKLSQQHGSDRVQ